MLRIRPRFAFCLLALAATPVAQAVDGTITINGEITDQTCKINGNPPPYNFIVNLPKISTSALKNVNDTAGATAFSIKVTDCPATLTGDIKAYFEPGASTDYEHGYLHAYSESAAKTTAVADIPSLVGKTPATNVAFQLANLDGTPIKIGVAPADQGALGQTLAATSTSDTKKTATLRYLVRYIKSGTGNIAAGKLVSYVQYSIVYP
ncbi:fimbrial protein [Bordetella trematum]|nr:fimbrial protein [Bordetella trematum]AUL45838.1 fimbrial protein [Bordetella trematum]QIM71216.1 fimbrial protein [Bordetella trematum]